jgi:hypothetical protein
MTVPQQSLPEGRCEEQDLQPGQIVPGKGIFIGEFDLFDAGGRSLGVRTRWYDAAIELGIPKTFNETAKAVSAFNDNGRGGLNLDPARYEAELFEKLRTGEALGKNAIAPLKVVRAIYALRNRGEYKRRSDASLPGGLTTLSSGTDSARWQWSCTPHRVNPFNVRLLSSRTGTSIGSIETTFASVAGCALRSWLFII